MTHDIPVRAVLFDLGGVYYTEGFRDGLLAIARKYGLAKDRFYTAAVETIHRTGYVTGRTPESEFWRALAGEAGIEEDLYPERTTILSAFRPADGMPELVARVRENIPVGLLTDQTNWLYEIDERDGLLERFDGVVSSYEEGYTKRDPEIFRVTCQRFDARPEELLFFDDNPDNIRTASGFGLRAHLFEGPVRTEEILIRSGPPTLSRG